MAKTPAAPTALTIDLSPSPEASKGGALIIAARALVVADKSTHGQAKLFIRDLKGSIRNIEDFHKRTKRAIDDLKRTALQHERDDVAPFQEAITIIEPRVIAYENAEALRVREEQDRLRRAAEEEARQRREQELAEQEAEALRLESTSPILSDRERSFVERIVLSWHPVEAARECGYKDAKATAERLMNSRKIIDAIAAKTSAHAIRQQATAQHAQPLNVRPVAAVESQTSKVAGTSTRTYYSAEILDADKLIDMVLAGKVSRSVLLINQSWLNQQATDLKDAFESVYGPAARLVKKQGIAG